MAHHFPQRIITLTVNGNDKNAQVYYTYNCPVKGLAYINSPVCDLLVNHAINSLFVLDYTSTLNGWRIIDTTPNGTPALEQYPGARNLSILTSNPYDKPGTYKFYINYHNTQTDATIHIDPQEGNIPR
jgi:hypothetical protein